MTSLYGALQRARQGGYDVALPAGADGGAPRPRARRWPPARRAPAPSRSSSRRSLPPCGRCSTQAAARSSSSSPRRPVRGPLAIQIAREFALLGGDHRAAPYFADRRRPQRPGKTARYFDSDTARGLVDGNWVGFEEADLAASRSRARRCRSPASVERSATAPADAVTLKGALRAAPRPSSSLSSSIARRSSAAE